MIRQKSAFEFSVIVPIYNVADYLEDAVDSLLDQTIGFRSSIEIVLVNDGSTDKSGEICKRYAERFPGNITYVEKDNGGVSSARNEGVKHIRGRYVNFLDGDDKWDKDAFKNAKLFFDNNPDIKIATGRFIYYGERVNKTHHLDYKYNCERIVDIQKDYKYPEFSVAHAFIAAELLEGRSFNENVKYSEDTLFINDILFEMNKYALLPNCRYYYRLRTSGTSAIDSRGSDLEWYFSTPEIVYGSLIEKSTLVYGEVIKYVQYLLATDLQWRLNKPIPHWLTKSEWELYMQEIRKYYSFIEGGIIATHKTMSHEFKSCVFRLKAEAEGADTRKIRGFKAFAKRLRPEIKILEEKNGMLHIEGHSREKFADKHLRLEIINDDGTCYKPVYRKDRAYDQSFLDGEVLIDGYSYTIDLPLNSGSRYSFFIRGASKEPYKVKPTCGKFSHISSSVRNSYWCVKNSIVSYEEGDIIIYPYDELTVEDRERELQNEIRALGKGTIADIREKAIDYARTKKGPIMLLMDRTERAGDNAEVMFRYMIKKGLERKYDISFVINKDSEDYDRLKQYGQVIPFGSEDHFIKLINADLVISSMWEDWVFNPFRDNWKYFCDLRNYKYVFLQSGVIKDDFSKRLNQHNKRIDLFLTTVKEERQSILDGPYGYDDSVVKMSGLPRFDELHNKQSKLVVLMPTWRKYLATSVKHGSSERFYMEAFSDSDYCRFFNRLVNDDRLISAMKQNGYKGVLCLHPSHMSQRDDFKGNDVFFVAGPDVNYLDTINKGSILITDYSSVAMDFAYLKKPVVYAQFDKDVFYNNHVYSKGYFDYEHEGFGPVCYSYDELIDKAVQLINGGCINNKEYLERRRRFFPMLNVFHRYRTLRHIIRLLGDN